VSSGCLGANGAVVPAPEEADESEARLVRRPNYVVCVH
jgi:hypothetical protein